MKLVHKYAKIGSLFLLFLHFGCHEPSNKNKYIIKNIQFELFDLEKKSSAIFSPKKFNASSTNEYALVVICLNKEFVSDSSDSCNIVFEGVHGNMDLIQKIYVQGLDVNEEKITYYIKNDSLLNGTYRNYSINTFSVDYTKNNKQYARPYLLNKTLDSIKESYNNMKKLNYSLYGIEKYLYYIIVKKSIANKIFSKTNSIALTKVGGEVLYASPYVSEPYLKE